MLGAGGPISACNGNSVSLDWVSSSYQPATKSPLDNDFSTTFVEEGMATHSSMPAWRIPMDRGTWQATDHGVTKSWTQLSN